METKYLKNVACCAMLAVAAPLSAVPIGLSFSSDVDQILGRIAACLSSGEAAVARFLNPSNNETFAAHLVSFKKEKEALEGLERDCQKALAKALARYGSGPKGATFKAARELVQMQLKIAGKLLAAIEAGGRSSTMLGLKLLRLRKEAKEECSKMQGCVSRMKIALGQVDRDRVAKAVAIGSKLAQINGNDFDTKRALSALDNRMATCRLNAPADEKKEARFVATMPRKWAALGSDRALALVKATLHHLHIRRQAEQAK